MSETVETADSNQNDVRIQDGKSKTSFSQLRTLKRDMERQGSLLEKTWSELNNIMSQYQAELIEKHEEVESTGTPVDHNRIHQLEKHISELEEKLLRKDTEIVKLRTEVHKYKNEVSMKDSLIEKVQTQMTKEALEFQTEINSLKDLLEKQNSVWNTANTVVPVAPKRRKVSSGLSLSSVQIGELATTSVASSAGTKSESVRSSCDLIPSAPVFPSPQPINDPTSQSSDHDGSMDVSAYDANADDADSSQSQHRTILAGALKIEETDDSYASDVYASLEQQDLDPTQDDGMLSGASADVGQTNQDRGLPYILPLTGEVISDTDAIMSKLGLVDRKLNNAAEDVITSTLGGIVPITGAGDIVQCQLCGTGLPKSSLIIHQRNKHGVKPYTCSYCALSFHIKADCSEHIRKEHKRSRNPFKKKKR